MGICLVGKNIVSQGRKSVQEKNSDFVIPINKIQYFIMGFGRPAECTINQQVNNMKDIPVYLFRSFSVLKTKGDNLKGKKLYCESEEVNMEKIAYSGSHHGQRGVFKGKCCFSMIIREYTGSKKFAIATTQFTLKDAKKLKSTTSGNHNSTF